MFYDRVVVIIVMGPAGAGKTTVGSALARALGWRFVDADDLHVAANVEKMRAGVGLTDEDRQPWLESVRRVIALAAQQHAPTVIACSALKREYRETITSGFTDVRIVYLHAGEALLRERLARRAGHFAGSALVETQVRDLEPPGAEALRLDAAEAPQALVTAIRKAWNL